MGGNATEYSASAICEPIGPDELARLKAVYDAARTLACLSRHDPSAERLAAMAIRFYQLGIHDDIALLEAIVDTNKYLSDVDSERSTVGAF